MPRCYFLLVVIGIAIIVMYKDFLMLASAIFYQAFIFHLTPFYLLPSPLFSLTAIALEVDPIKILKFMMSSLSK